MPPSSLATVTAKPMTPAKKRPIITDSDSPGNWRHPRLAEITRRRGKSVFSESNAKTISYNVGVFVFLLMLHQVARAYAPSGLLTAPLRSYATWAYWLLLAIPTVNVGIALLPLLRRQDDLSDVPLTPGQRKLLGLPPSSAPPTPNSAFSTPPRYSRTPSMAGSAASNRSYSSSPLSNNASSASERRYNGSPYSPASPLLHKAIAAGFGGSMRSSLGSPSPRGTTSGASLFDDGPGTPSPTTGKRSSVGLNNKWLYEKGRRSSSSPFMH